jgi:hypothetical protein
MSVIPPLTESLFSYGTLQLESVQLATFGRRLAGAEDTLTGFEQSLVRIDDPAVVETSGNTHHPIVKFTGSAKHKVKGVVFRVSAEELHNADTYEVAAYKRVAVTLGSGTRAWVYIDGRFVPPNP